jgi:hypothetical protein
VLPWLPDSLDRLPSGPLELLGPRPRVPRVVGRRPAAGPGRLRPVPRSGLAAFLGRAGLPFGGRLRPGQLIALLVVAALAVVAAVAVALAWRGGARMVSTPFLTYAAPAGWTADPVATTAPLDAPALTGTVRGAGYDCGGEAHVRGYAAAAFLPADTSAGSGPADRAERLARWFAMASYATADGAPPAVTVAPPRPVRVAGPDGPVDATVSEVTTQAVGTDGCPPLGGTVLALAAPVSGGAALLLVAGDTGGGPAAPAPPDRATLDAVLASVRVGPG